MYRLNDRKRSIMYQKQMAHKRLIRHQKRLDITLDDKDRRIVSIERRKEELVSVRMYSVIPDAVTYERN